MRPLRRRVLCSRFRFSSPSQQESASMRHAVIVLVAASCLSVFARAQSAEELVDKNIQAKGGLEKMKAIHSMRMSGKLNAGGGFIAGVTQENMRPSLVRQTFS